MDKTTLPHVTTPRQEPQDASHRVFNSDGELAEFLGTTKYTIRQLRRQGKLRYISIGRKVLYPWAAVRAFLEGGTEDVGHG